MGILFIGSSQSIHSKDMFCYSVFLLICLAITLNAMQETSQLNNGGNKNPFLDDTNAFNLHTEVEVLDGEGLVDNSSVFPVLYLPKKKEVQNTQNFQCPKV